MKRFDINNSLLLYRVTDGGRLSSNRSGFPPVSEATILKGLAAAIEERDGINKAIKNMRDMLGMSQPEENDYVHKTD